MNQMVCVLVMAGLSACAGGVRLRPLETPDGSAQAPAQVAAPRQVQLDPPPPPPAPIPKAARRVAVIVTERINREAQARRDSESEAIVAETLLSVAQELELEVVRKGTQDEILAREMESLAQQGLAESTTTLANLLQAGVELVALAEVGASEIERDIGRGRVITDKAQLHAGVQLVRTDDATVLAAGNASAEGQTTREAKNRAIGEAARRMVENLRAAPQGSPARMVTVVVAGLSKIEQAERILKRLRETEGVAWTRDLSFSSGKADAKEGVARYELGWLGSPDTLRQRIAKLDAGVKLEATRIEGARWTYQASEAAAPPAESPKKEG